MSNAKEKLSGLLGYYLPPIDRSRCVPYVNGKCNGMCSECTAELLIANGVTVQEWIPVSERLPEINGRVLVYRPGMPFEIHVARYSDIGWNRWDAIDDNTPHGAITHWMPLPEPPKGG